MCLCVCVFIFLLKLCFVSCIAILWYITYQTSNHERKVYRSIYKKEKRKRKSTRLKPTNIKNRNKWICCELRPFIEKPSSSINNFYLFIFKLKYAYIENKLLIPNITLLVFVFNEKMKKKDYLDNLLLHGFFPF